MAIGSMVDSKNAAGWALIAVVVVLNFKASYFLIMHPSMLGPAWRTVLELPTIAVRSHDLLRTGLPTGAAQQPRGETRGAGVRLLFATASCAGIFSGHCIAIKRYSSSTFSVLPWVSEWFLGDEIATRIHRRRARFGYLGQPG